jgi:hypothetical protein
MVSMKTRGSLGRMSSAEVAAARRAGHATSSHLRGAAASRAWRHELGGGAVEVRPVLGEKRSVFGRWRQLPSRLVIAASTQAGARCISRRWCRPCGDRAPPRRRSRTAPHSASSRRILDGSLPVSHCATLLPSYAAGRRIPARLSASGRRVPARPSLASDEEVRERDVFEGGGLGGEGGNFDSRSSLALSRSTARIGRAVRWPSNVTDREHRLKLHGAQAIIRYWET